MPHHLHEDISCCRVEGHLISLDIANDRYFRVAPALEQAIVAYDEGSADPGCVRELAAHGLLVGNPGVPVQPMSTGLPVPRRSALERPATTAAIRATAFARVAYSVLVSQAQLKASTLKRAIASLAAYRKANAPDQARHAGAPLTQDHEAAADLFRRIRPYVPCDTCCLLDSLALIRFMAMQKLHGTLVFGVTGAPFSAHCWVQTGDMVLNDSVGNANAHTPIRVI